jgi:uncharacterized protein (DUF488 family)
MAKKRITPVRRITPREEIWRKEERRELPRTIAKKKKRATVTITKRKCLRKSLACRCWNLASKTETNLVMVV